MQLNIFLFSMFLNPNYLFPILIIVTIWETSRYKLKIILFQKLFWPFTSNFGPSALNFRSFSGLLEQFFLTAGQYNFGNKIPFLLQVILCHIIIFCQIYKDLLKLFYNSKLAKVVFWILEIFVNLINSVIVFWIICLYLWQRTTCKNPSTHLKIFRTFFVIQDSALGVALVKLASDAPAGDFSAVGRPCDRCQAVLWRMRDLEFQGSAIHVPYVDL